MSIFSLIYFACLPLFSTFDCWKIDGKNQKCGDVSAHCSSYLNKERFLCSSDRGLTPPLHLPSFLLLLFYYSPHGPFVRNICITKTQLNCYSDPPHAQSAAHKHKLATVELSPPKRKPSSFCLRKIATGLIGLPSFPPIPPPKHWFGPAFQGGGVCRLWRGVMRIPWRQKPGSGLETSLLKTEVLGVDLSIWMSTMGFCTSRKRRGFFFLFFFWM